MASIALYIAPFGLQTPFQVPISSEGSGNPACTVSERINELVRELHAQATTNHLAIYDDEVTQDFIPASGEWVLFCLVRRTIIPSQIVNKLCTVLTPTKSKTVGEFLILPIPKTFISSDTLLETLSKILPSKVVHTTYSQYLKSLPRCFFCTFVRNAYRCSNCLNCTKRAFHINQVTCPPWVAGTAKQYLHLGLWIPRIAAPCDLIVRVDENPIPDISSIIRALQPTTTPHSSPDSTPTQYAHPLGDYPTEQNWVLLDFANKKFFHKDHFRELQIQRKLELAGQSKTYAVIPVHCGSMAGAMLDAVMKKEGSVGWEEFWQGRLRTRVSGEDDRDQDIFGLMTPPDTGSPDDS